VKNINLKGTGLIGAVVIFFLLLFVYTKLFGPIPFTVHNINTLNNTPFEAHGIGKASAAPDKAMINLGVTESGTTVLEAQDKTNKAVSNILNGLEELGVEEKDIKTTNYSVRPEYSELGRTQTVSGYVVTQNIEVKVPIDQANKAVDTATTNGANLVGSISFVLDDETLEKLRNEAREEAVENAKASAEGLAKAAGISLGKIINVQESFDGGGPVPMMRAESMTIDIDDGEQIAPTTITPGESNVEVSVKLTYQTN